MGQCLPLPSVPLLFDGGPMTGTTGCSATLSSSSEELMFRNADVQCCYVYGQFIFSIGKTAPLGHSVPQKILLSLSDWVAQLCPRHIARWRHSSRNIPTVSRIKASLSARAVTARICVMAEVPRCKPKGRRFESR
jgi:hypothetical protein